MKKLCIGLVAVCVGFAAPAFGAGFLKFDDVPGESKDNQNTAPDKVKGQDPKAPVLLVPAVQKAREAARSNESQRKGKPEQEWKVEEGDY